MQIEHIDQIVEYIYTTNCFKHRTRRCAGHLSIIHEAIRVSLHLAECLRNMFIQYSAQIVWRLIPYQLDGHKKT